MCRSSLHGLERRLFDPVAHDGWAGSAIQHRPDSDAEMHCWKQGILLLAIPVLTETGVRQRESGFGVGAVCKCPVLCLSLRGKKVRRGCVDGRLGAAYSTRLYSSISPQRGRCRLLIFATSLCSPRWIWMGILLISRIASRGVSDGSLQISVAIRLGDQEMQLPLPALNPLDADKSVKLRRAARAEIPATATIGRTAKLGSGHGSPPN